jgi:hypothetical protein
MNKLNIYAAALLIACSLTTSAYFAGDKLWHGAIKFPILTKKIPKIAIYYTGISIPTHIQTANRQLTFDISESKIRTTFYLIVIEHVDLVTEQNTVKYFVAPTNSSYKLYHLQFTPNQKLIKGSGPAEKIDQDKKQTDLEEMGTWTIEQQSLPEDRRIPDNAIIVCYNPSLIKNVEGGNGLELPKIILDEQIIQQLGDEELQNVSDLALLTSLDYNSIHARQNSLVKHDFAKKNIISMIYS